MLGWFRKLLPREDGFFELFERHSRTVVGGAEALELLLQGKDIDRWCQKIIDLEDEADHITAEVLLAVRRSFITPFDRGDIKDLIQSMDDAIDMMHKTVKTVKLFEKKEFDPLMQEMGGVIVAAAKLVAEAIPLLSKVGTHTVRLNAIAEEVMRVESRADDLHEADDDRPHGDEEQQHERGNARHHERKQAGEHAGNTDDGQPPAVPHDAAPAGDGVPQRKYAVDQYIGAPQEDQRQQREAGPGEGEDAKHDGRNSAQQQEPPVVGQSAQKRAPKRRDRS